MGKRKPRLPHENSARLSNWPLFCSHLLLVSALHFLKTRAYFVDAVSHQVVGITTRGRAASYISPYHNIPIRSFERRFNNNRHPRLSKKAHQCTSCSCSFELPEGERDFWGEYDFGGSNLPLSSRAPVRKAIPLSSLSDTNRENLLLRWRELSSLHAVISNDHLFLRRARCHPALAPPLGSSPRATLPRTLTWLSPIALGHVPKKL